MNEHKGITPTQLADRNLALIGGALHHDRYSFLYDQYIQLLSKISANDYAAEVDDLLNFEANA
jgi:menaquinone-dependent protoporphyrinogen IX oxidase